MTALADIRILELSHTVSSEYCAKLLADFGAEIIKIEPAAGSPVRGYSPLAADKKTGENSGLFAYLNTNKYSVALDLETDKGRELLAQLLAKVDVLVTDYAQDELSVLGVDVKSLEQCLPELICCVITPFGFDASSAATPAYDLNVMHASGWGFHTPSSADDSKPPLKGPGRFLVSYESGLDAAMCISSALFDRQQSKLGQLIDISEQAVMASRTDYVLGQMIAGDMNVSTDRKAYDLAGPADIYPCKDGFIYIWMSAPSHWQALAEMMGKPEWMNEFPENWLERECTPERVALCREYLAPWLLQQEKVQFAEAAQKLGLIVVPVNNAGDLLECAQYQYREFFQIAEHPVLGELKYPSAPYKLSATPARIHSSAPLLGQHTQQKLSELLNAGGEA